MSDQSKTGESGSVEIGIDESIEITPELSEMIVGHVISNALDWPTIMRYLGYGFRNNGRRPEH